MASRLSIGPADTELSEHHGTLTVGRPANPRRLLGTVFQTVLWLLGNAFLGRELAGRLHTLLARPMLLLQGNVTARVRGGSTGCAGTPNHSARVVCVFLNLSSVRELYSTPSFAPRSALLGKVVISF